MQSLKFDSEVLLRWGLVLLMNYKFADQLLTFSSSFSIQALILTAILSPLVLFTRSAIPPLVTGLLLFVVNSNWLEVAGVRPHLHHMLVMAAAFWCLCFSRDKKLFRLSLSLLIFTVYILAGLRKLHPEFLNGMRLEQLAREVYYGSEMVFPAWSILLVQVTAGLTALGEIFLAFFPWTKHQLRKVALCFGIFFHLAIWITLPVSVFSALMILLLMVLWPLEPEARPDVKTA